MVFRLIKSVTLLYILSSGMALSSVSLKNHSNSFEDFKNYIENQKFLIDTLEQPNAEYYTNYLDSLSDLNTELSVLKFFKESTIIEPQYVYTHYILSLNKLNKISKDYPTNQDMLQGSFLNLFSNENSNSNNKNNIVDKIDTACLCATEGQCEGQETESACIPNSEPNISKLVPIAGLGGMVFAINDTNETSIYSGTSRDYNSTVAEDWLTNNEYRFVNFARDLSIIAENDNNNSNYIDNNNTDSAEIPLQDFPHPYTQLGVNDAYAYGLSGQGVTVSVMDLDLCYSQESGAYSNDNFDHYDLAGKYVTTYGNYDYEYFTSAADWVASGQGHGCHVATTAVGSYNSAAKPSDSLTGSYIFWNSDLTEAEYGVDFGYSIDLPSSMMGVAYASNLHFADMDGGSNSSLCNGDNATNCLGPQHWELATEDAIDNNAKVQNNSWGYLGDVTPQTIAAYSSGTNAKRFADYANDSLGSAFSETQISDWIEALNNFQKQGVIVWATSNDNSNTMSTVWGAETNKSDISSSLPILFDELSEAWITVANVATYSDGSKLLYSGPCSSNAEYCVVHDGLRITAGTDVFFNGAVYSSFISSKTGTSMAAPQISGAIALLTQAFPDNSPELIAKRLLYTSDNSWFDNQNCFRDNNGDGLVGNDEFSNHCGGYDGQSQFNGLTHSYSNLYGHGNPDLHKALQPIGTNRVAGINGNEMLFVGSGLLLSSYIGDSLNLNSETAIFRDQLQGGFEFNLGDLVSENKEIRLHERMKKSPFDRWNTISDTEKYNLSFASAGYDQNENSLNDDIGIYTSLTSGNQKFYFGNKYSVDKLLGLKQSNNAFSILTAHNNDNSFLSLTEAAGNGQVFGDQIKVSNGITLNIAGYIGKSNKLDLNEKGLLASITNKFDDYNDVTFFVGQNIEDDSVLRLSGSGAFGNLSGETFHTGMTFNRHLYKNVHVAGLANLGITNNKDDQYGLISDFNDIITSQFNIGLVASKVYSNNDLFSVNISQPLRTESGSAKLNLPGSMNADGSHNFIFKHVDLVPSGREINFDIGYEKHLFNSGAFRFGSQITFETSHKENQKTNSLIYGLYKIDF